MKYSFTPEEVDQIENKAYEVGEQIGRRLERERIRARIQTRINDLRSCIKDDDCGMLADCIESYLPEWVWE